MKKMYIDVVHIYMFFFSNRMNGYKVMIKSV